MMTGLEPATSGVTGRCCVQFAPVLIVADEGRDGTIVRPNDQERSFRGERLGGVCCAEPSYRPRGLDRVRHLQSRRMVQLDFWNAFKAAGRSPYGVDTRGQRAGCEENDRR